MKARDLMTAHVAICAAQDTLARAAQVMWEADCGCLPVTDTSGGVVGMITDRDICMAAYTRGKLLDAVTVESVMCRDVAGCHPDDSISTIENTMRERQIRRVPVIERGRLVGIVTLGDLVRATQSGTVRATLSVPGVLKATAGIYERRGVSAAAE
jgi:CBS domain-containing protein